MPHTLKIAAGALATFAAIAVPATVASALPATYTSTSIGTTTVVIPPKPVVPKFPTVPIGPATPLAALSDFSVTTDSVIATATIHFNGSVSDVTVRWGDGSSSSRNPSIVSTVAGAPQDAPGTVTFQHEYAAGPNGTAFSLFATGQVTSAAGTESDVRQVTITPRFRVNAYQAYFANEYECGDPFYESETEWRVDRTLTTFSNGQSSSATKSWSFDRAADDNIVPEYDFMVLSGSQVQLDLTMADQHPSISWKATELDTFYDDVFTQASIDLHPSLGTRSTALTLADGDCHVMIKTDVNVALLRPGLQTGGIGGGGLATQ